MTKLCIVLICSIFSILSITDAKAMNLARAVRRMVTSNSAPKETSKPVAELQILEVVYRPERSIRSMEEALKLEMFQMLPGDVTRMIKDYVNPLHPVTVEQIDRSALPHESIQYIVAEKKPQGTFNYFIIKRFIGLGFETIINGIAYEKQIIPAKFFSKTADVVAARQAYEAWAYDSSKRSREKYWKNLSVRCRYTPSPYGGNYDCEGNLGSDDPSLPKNKWESVAKSCEGRSQPSEQRFSEEWKKARFERLEAEFNNIHALARGQYFSTNSTVQSAASAAE